MTIENGDDRKEIHDEEEVTSEAIEEKDNRYYASLENKCNKCNKCNNIFTFYFKFVARDT